MDLCWHLVTASHTNRTSSTAAKTVLICTAQTPFVRLMDAGLKSQRAQVSKYIFILLFTVMLPTVSKIEYLLTCVGVKILATATRSE